VEILYSLHFVAHTPPLKSIEQGFLEGMAIAHFYGEKPHNNPFSASEEQGSESKRWLKVPHSLAS
jgi:hypothetical protein